MAVQIVGEAPEARKRITCRRCGAVLEYLPVDVKEQHGTDYGGGPDGREWIDCPRCDHEVIIKSW